MAVGGYASEMQRRGTVGPVAVFATPPPPRSVLSHSSSNGSDSGHATGSGGKGNNDTGLRYMKFPLPVVDSAVIYSPSAMAPGCGVAEASNDCGSVSGGISGGVPGKESQLASSVITVVCVNFHHIEEVVRLWLDNVKIFSDFASSEPAEVSKNATFCLRVSRYSITFV